MTTGSTDRAFPWPEDMTRRERLEFSKHAGLPVQALAELIKENGAAAVTVEAETALILIAARRRIPDATFDDVLDNDGWTLEAPPESDEDGGSPKA